MKKLMLGLLMAFAVTAEAAVISDVQIGDLKYTLDTEAKTATITGYTGSPKSVDVSEVEYEGQKYTVTSVWVSAFLGCSSLASVSLPNATTIGNAAFLNCSSLTSVSLPNATTIGRNAFQNCPNLTTVSLLSVVSIGKDAFGWCNALSTLIVNGIMKSVIETNGRSEYGLSDSVQITPAQGDLRFVPEGSVVVSKESIAAPSAGTVKVEDNKVKLGVTVLKTSDLTAETKEWGEVTLTAEDVKVVDGKIVISVPVDSASGFMVIQTKDAAK